MKEMPILLTMQCRFPEGTSLDEIHNLWEPFITRAPQGTTLTYDVTDASKCIADQLLAKHPNMKLVPQPKAAQPYTPITCYCPWCNHEEWHEEYAELEKMKPEAAFPLSLAVALGKFLGRWIKKNNYR